MIKGTVGTSPTHLNGREHVSGRSVFVGDGAPLPGMLYIKVLTSPIAHGRIAALDTSNAWMPGVEAILTYRDIPGENQIGGIIQDECLLAEDQVHFVGEPIAVVAATSKAIAQEAVKRIRLEIEELPAILTIDEALRADSFVGPVRKIERGDIEKAFSEADHILEGVAVNGGQEHFYLETQRTRALPEENGGVTLYASTQNPNEVQIMAAQILGLSRVDVTVDVKRLGGAFGGKEVQATSWACMAALVAFHTRKPAEIVLEREEDLAWTGKRHPYQSPYRIAFNKDGRILGYSVELNANCGAVADVSTSILERAMLHAENVYYIPNIRIIGRPCKTNLPPNTAYRGFGAPQGIFVIETAIHRVAKHLGLDPQAVRRVNLYQEGQTTPYGEPVTDNLLEDIFDRVERGSEWQARQEEIRDFNQTSRFVKKGLAITPVKFGISFTAAFLNQGSALIRIYGDGSVSVSHGAIEMGQEVNTKIAQIVATTLGVSLERIRVESNNTKRIANASPTAASSGADLNGHAAENAASQIAERLKAFAAGILGELEPGLSSCPEFVHLENDAVYDERCPQHKMRWTELIGKAYFQRVDLGAHGFYATPGVSFDREIGKGHPFLYYVFGAAASEVTVDLLTGQTTVDRVTVVHDAGQSLNPAVDIGQVQGAFMQGQGWATFEELLYDGGRLMTCSPATYKIPTMGDLPNRFEVELVENQRNVRGVKRSKAIGEPPFVYGESVYFAIQEAIGRELTLPATPEKVVLSLRKVSRPEPV